jgi:uncharacterized protein
MNGPHTPKWIYAALGAVAAFALISLGTALWVQLPKNAKQAGTNGGVMLPLDLPILPTSVPTELPPVGELFPVKPLLVMEVPSVTQPLPMLEITSSVPPLVAPFYPAKPAKLALVIDDMGQNIPETKSAMALLPETVTFAFMPHAPGTAELAPKAHAEGHAILVHLPMEPQPHPEGTPDLGPHGLRVGMSSETLATEVVANLQPLEGLAEGVNNHMGSRFTQWPEGLQVVLAQLADKNFYFLDSRTAAPTATDEAAQGLNLKRAARDVFLDHNPIEDAVRAELLRAVKLSQKRGGRAVVVIGHPLPATLAVLKADLPLLAEAGVELVPLKSVVK